MDKGIAYFKDGHTEKIAWCHTAKDPNYMVFRTPTGLYHYSVQIESTDSGYLFTKHIFERFDDSINEYVPAPIEQIVLV